MTTKPNPKDEITARLVEFFTDAIERGIATGNDWRKPWRELGTDIWSPMNHETNRPYNGGNVVILAFEAMLHGYTSGRWGTYNCFNRVGGQVRKGEKSVGILRPTIVDKPCEPTDPGAKRGKSGWFRSVLVGWSTIRVFNVAQVDGLPEIEVPEPVHPIEAAEAWLSAVVANGPVDLRYGGNIAGFAPIDDYVVMPERNAFVSPEAFYGTVAHELIHWTGHKSRLGRITAENMSNPDTYAREELIAELGATITLSSLGIEPTTRPDHMHYLANWVTMLRAEPGILWTVSGAAAKASDHLDRISEGATASAVAA